MKTKARVLPVLLAVCLCVCAPNALAARERSEEYRENMDKIQMFSAITSGLFEGEALTAIDPNKPMVALTFDDGPSKYTGKILDILTRHGGRATFFMVGNRVANYPGVVERVAAQGSEIATHTWSHADLKTLSAKGVESQLSRSVKALLDAGGQSVGLMRPPYGNFNDQVKEICKNMGLPIIRWSVDTEDWKTKDAQSTYDAVMEYVGHGSIVLCHDIVESTVDAMEMVIPELVRQGYQLVTVTEMFEAAGVTLEPGEAYYRLE